MTRWIVAFVLVVLSTVPAAARGPDSLTPEVRQHLESLMPLRDKDRVRFEGRPVLVKFFASW